MTYKLTYVPMCKVWHVYYKKKTSRIWKSTLVPETKMQVQEWAVGSGNGLVELVIKMGMFHLMTTIEGHQDKIKRKGKLMIPLAKINTTLKTMLKITRMGRSTAS